MRPQTWTKVDLKPKKHHGFSVLLFIMGTLFPPLAVAARFGIGTDFFLNLLLTICGYIPGHVHNFYIQNVRNNKNKQRTPKWIQRYGLVNTAEIKRKERRSQWAGRYNDRLPRSTLENQPYEEGQEVQEGGSSIDLSNEDGDTRPRANGSGELWSRREEQYYGANGDATSVRTAGSGRWHYPANFEDTIPAGKPKKSSKKKKEKKDRWARTEDAYSIGEGQSTKRRKSKRKSRTADSDTTSRASESTTEFPEDPEGGLYGDRPHPVEESPANGRTDADDIFNHEL
ncbi:hypothetical protein CERSUDRAFT_113479 [Gelatoporia subvermispora B]|uniref:Uncharacterized protein n=1 Tax=Ceriporiopsis subvermispora (strain B) TaxID=914234 RepID=M2RHN0_CERS8|nr:hypothetical protein CERSUDRAFT_113479 [Gelatoporia subvermispora B]